MKWLLSVAGLIGILFLSHPAIAQCNNTNLSNGITCVSSTTATSVGSDLTVGPITSSGNLEVITIQKYHTMGTPLAACEVTDSKNASPTLVSVVSGGTGTFGVEIWYIANPVTGAGHTIHCSYGDARMTVIFYQTPVQLGPDLYQQAAGGRGQTVVTVPALTPTRSPALIVGTCTAAASDALTMTNLTEVASAAGGPAGIDAHTVQPIATPLQTTCSSNPDQGLGIGAMTAAFVPTDCMGASPNWTSSTPNETTVAECLKYMKAGDTLTIGPGTAMWDTPLVWSAPPNVTIQGQTVCTGSGRPGEPPLNCVDNTTIIDAVQDPGNDHHITWRTDVPEQGGFRMSGITFKQISGVSEFTYACWISFDGLNHAFRFDHNHVIGVGEPGGLVRFNGWILGVLDHDQFEAPIGSGSSNHIQVWHSNWGGYANGFGDGSWADDPKYSSDEFLFVEDSSFTGGFANDLIEGGRLIFRYNSFDRAEIQIHNGVNRQRAGRILEVYANQVVCDPNVSGCGAKFVGPRGGTVLIWGNHVDNISGLLTAPYDRREDRAVGPPPPYGWGNCGLWVNPQSAMGPTDWDENTDATGYACLDQPGRGKGDLFPNVVQGPPDFIPFWPHQQKEPMYIWDDVVTPAPFGFPFRLVSGFGVDVARGNRDIFYCSVGGVADAGDCAAFTGTVTVDGPEPGVGSGLWANRPSTCTPWTAYWATDQGGNWNTVDATANDGELFVCDMNNTFQPYYTPYTYPHPLATPIEPQEPMMVFTQQPTSTVSGQHFNPAVSVGILGQH